MNNLIKDIHIDNNGVVSFELLDGTIHGSTINLYERANLEELQAELILDNLEDDFVLENSHRDGTIAFYDDDSVFLKTDGLWSQIYDEVNKDEHLTIDEWSGTKEYEPNDPFHHDGKKYFSIVSEETIVMPPLVNFDFVNTDTIIESGDILSMVSDREFIHYETASTYTVYDNLNKRINASANSRNGLKLTNDIFIKLLDGVLTYAGSAILSDIVAYCKYGNYIYTIGNDRVISKRRIGRLERVVKTYDIDDDITIDGDTLLSFGSESFGFYNKSINKFSLMHGDDVYEVITSAFIDYVSIADRGNIIFHNSNTDTICSSQVFTQAVPFTSDFILNSDKDAGDTVMSVDLKEIYENNIYNYGESYGIDFKDITLDNSGILFSLDTSGRVHRIAPTTGSIYSVSNSMVSGNNIIEGAQSIGMIGGNLYVTMITDMRVRQIDMETLEPNGTALSMESLGDSYIQSIAEGISGDIAILTDAGSLHFLESLVSEPMYSTQLTDYTSFTKVIPADSRSFFASHIRGNDNTVYRIFNDSKLEQPVVNPNGDYRQFLTLSDSYVGLSVDDSQNGRLHVYETSTDLDNI